MAEVLAMIYFEHVPPQKVGEISATKIREELVNKKYLNEFF